MTVSPHSPNTEIANEISEIVASSPQASPLRSRNPNLHSEPEARPNRNATLSRKKPSGPNPFAEYSQKTAKAPDCVKQPFWKFHIIKFGQSLYLTTNPTLRHLHCRNAPGYFVQISTNARGYLMEFEDIETGEQLVKVEKKSDSRGDYFHYEVSTSRCVQGGHVISSDQEAERGEGEDHQPNGSTPNNTDRLSRSPASSPDFHTSLVGTLLRKPIPESLLPTAPITPMLNYESNTIGGQKWNVGSLPRVRESRLGSSESKYVFKKNIYLHRCFENTAQYYEWAVPPAVAVYRECESRSKKRVMRQIRRLSQIAPGAKEAPMFSSAEPFSEPDPAPASPYSEITSYYKCGDGVYFEKNPADDEPDHHHKLGWVSVYEDGAAFERKGMFDWVVAVTVAIGYERQQRFGADAGSI